MSNPENQTRINLMTKMLTTEFQPTALSIYDESYKHKGHAGAKTGKGHFALYITSPLFNNRSKIDCHRMIYSVLRPLFEHDIHAINIYINQIQPSQHDRLT